MRVGETTNGFSRFEAFAATFLIVEFTADLLMWIVYSFSGIQDFKQAHRGPAPVVDIAGHYFVGTFGQFDPVYSLAGYEWGLASLWPYGPGLVVGLCFARWRGYV